MILKKVKANYIIAITLKERQEQQGKCQYNKYNYGTPTYNIINRSIYVFVHYLFIIH